MALRICTTVVLARLLSPTDYGLQSMVITLTGFFSLFQDAGLNAASVQRDTLTHEQISTLFWGIVDFSRIADTLATRLSEQGARVVTGALVTRLTRAGSGWITQATAGDFEADFVINCAGLYCDRVAEMAGECRETRILPFRDEYYKLKAERPHLARNLIYPVPTRASRSSGYIHSPDSRRHRSRFERRAGMLPRRLSQNGFQPTGPLRRALLRRVLALSAELPVNGLVRTASFIQPQSLLPLAPAPCPRDSAR